MTTEVKPTQAAFNITFVDRPEVQEVFGDRIRSVAVVEGVMHIELCCTRVVATEGGQSAMATAHTSGRWIMPLGTAVALRDILIQHLAELERQGALKIMPTATPTPTAPKH